MAGSTRFSFGSILEEARSSPGAKHIIIFAIIYLIFLIAMVFWGRNWERHKGIFGLWFVAYLFLMFLILRSGSLKKLEKMNPVFILTGIFILGMALHLPLLLRDPSMSQDLLKLDRNAGLLLDGQVPYRDFDVNRPPLYIWMAGAFSIPFGPDQQVFRIFFTIANSLVPVVMVLIHRVKTGLASDSLEHPSVDDQSGFGWLGGAFGYMLCPTPILETALAGHFDPVVVLTTVLSFYYLIKGRSALSGFMLGTGLALKLYPIFLAPLFFLSFPRWKDRLMFSVGFALPMILSSVPLMMIDLTLLPEYTIQLVYNQTADISIMGGIEGILEYASIPVGITFYLMTGIVLLVVIHFARRGTKGFIKRSDALFVGALTFLFSSMMIMLSTIYMIDRASGNMDIALGWIGILLSMIFLGSGVYDMLRVEVSKDILPGHPRSKKMTGRAIDPLTLPLLASCILVILILASPQFHPWYLPWVLPFLLASGKEHFTWSLLFLLSSIQLNGYLPWEI